MALDEGESAELARQCLAVGRTTVDLLMIREKELAAGELARLSRSVLAGLDDSGLSTRIVIARRADVAAAVQAHGVHLSSRPGELSASQVRAVFRSAGRPEPFVSVSCHSIAEVRRARVGGASAVLFAPVFGKQVGARQVVDAAGLDALAEACSSAGAMLVFALGGVTEENATACTTAGAAGVAGIRMFFGA